MTVPQFKQYFPSLESMDEEQLLFYNEVERKLSNGTYIDVEGNISYVFVFIYKLLGDWNKFGFNDLSDYLIYLSELYKHEPVLSDYCKIWAYDCLLGLERYEEYLEKTEPNEIFGTSTHRSNLRLNVQNKIGFPANPIDILLMSGGRQSKFIKSNQALYKDKIREVFEEYAEKNGEWFSLFNNWLENKQEYGHSLFQGAIVDRNPKLSFGILCFYTINKCLQITKELAKEAENATRKEIGVPLVGEGWVSETELFKKLEDHFSQTKVVQHGQPSWLGRQHYDVWFPNWKIAVEYHGKQHFEPVEFFGGSEAFEKNVERDQRKINLSKRHGIKLFVVKEDDEINELIQSIEKHIEARNVKAPK